MNSAQHLVVILGLLLGMSVQAQQASETPVEGGQEAVSIPAEGTSEPSSVSSEVPTEPPVENPVSATPEAASDDEVKSSEATSEPPAEPSVAPAEEMPAPQKSLLKSAANKDYNKPMYFDQIDNGLLLPPMEVEYDLTLQQGKTLKLGPVLLNENTFTYAVMPLGKSHIHLNQVLTAGESNKEALIMTWPNYLINSGTLEVISRTGKVLWKYEISESEKKRWMKKLSWWRSALLAKSVPAAELNGGIFASQFAITDLKGSGAPFWRQNTTFRFCLTQVEGRNNSKLCSQWYGNKMTGKALTLGRVRSEATTPRILFNNEEASLKQSAAVTSDGPTSLYADLATGESYEFVSVPNKLQLMDISDTSRKTILRIVGYDTRPLGKSIILNPDQYTKLTKLLGFEDTIGDPRKFWAAIIKTDDAKIYLPGQGGGIFKQRFELSEIPLRQSRVFLSRKTPTGTYNDGLKLFARKQPSSTVTSDQNSVEMDKSDPTLFMWRFRATERGEINRSYLNVEFEGKSYKSFFEIYKGYPRELSGRLSMVKSATDFIFMGEVAYNQWFEDILGWTNYYVSRQRWGVSLKYFRSFNELKVNTAGRTAPLSVLTADLKYRLTPGLWNRDETLGMMASYQDVNFDVLKAPMLGVGIFWARSMPKIFDDVMNLVPLFKYPKWVDVEFIYYLNSMDSAVKLNSSMALNFHGKVLWSQNVFGEAGFGIKRYAFQNASLNQKAELNTFYGTAGIGISF